MKASIISLGCPRNLLDSEIIAGSLKRSGFDICDSENGADVCIVNTCAFIESARKESVDRILEAARQKAEGRFKYLVVCGCLPQLYKDKLAGELKEADLLLGTSDFPKLPRLLKDMVIHRCRGRLNVPYDVDKSETGSKSRSFISRSLNYLYDEDDPRLILTPGHYAYIKISEGCSNFCSYCIISRLRGKFRSRSSRSVINEAKDISGSGVLKEIDIIGQDTTFFGFDIYGKLKLAELLRKICRIDNSVRWIRLLYTHPKHYTKELIRTVREEPKICKYLDIPLQHISDKILKRMNRGISRRGIERLICDIRKNVPGIVLRTSMIVGFPGETDRDFKELLDFVRRARFERLGAFVYSKEEGTKAAKLGGQIPDKVKRQRLDELMRLQQSISSGINRSLIGKVIEVLIDEKVEGERSKFVGRTEGDAPEIDGVVYVTGKSIRPGGFCRVRITGSMEYDLIGDKV